MSIEEKIEYFENFFNWDDQVKTEETLRWEVMYGIQPQDFIKEIKQALLDIQKETASEYIKEFNLFSESLIKSGILKEFFDEVELVNKNTYKKITGEDYE